MAWNMTLFNFSDSHANLICDNWFSDTRGAEWLEGSEKSDESKEDGPIRHVRPSLCADRAKKIGCLTTSDFQKQTT